MLPLKSFQEEVASRLLQTNNIVVDSNSIRFAGTIDGEADITFDISIVGDDLYYTRDPYVFAWTRRDLGKLFHGVPPRIHTPEAITVKESLQLLLSKYGLDISVDDFNQGNLEDVISLGGHPTTIVTVTLNSQVNPAWYGSLTFEAGDFYDLRRVYQITDPIRPEYPLSNIEKINFMAVSCMAIIFGLYQEGDRLTTLCAVELSRALQMLPSHEAFRIVSQAVVKYYGSTTNTGEILPLLHGFPIPTFTNRLVVLEYNEGDKKVILAVNF